MRHDPSHLVSEPQSRADGYADLSVRAREAFGDHPFAVEMDRERLEAVLPDYLGMSLAFRYLQAAAQKDAIFEAIRDNRDVPEGIELMNAVANFLVWDEAGGIDLMASQGKAGLPQLLDTARFHSSLLRKDALELLGHPIAPNFGPVTRRYLEALYRGLASTDVVVRCAHMVAFEIHANAMIDALWTAVSAATGRAAQSLGYFERHVGGDDPAEEYHVDMTQRLVARVVPLDERERFRREFESAYALHLRWCRALVGDAAVTDRLEPEPTVWHAGRCHCGGVRFEVRAPAVLQAIRCNCSICSMSGHLHLLVPAIDFRSLGGEDLLSTYQFGLGVAKHTFCSVCGTKPYYRPRSDPSGYSVNVRCLEPSTIADVEVSDFDGRHWEDAIERLMARAREPGASQRLDVTADLQSA